jgi:hypothetical protein
MGETAHQKVPLVKRWAVDRPVVCSLCWQTASRIN